MNTTLMAINNRSTGRGLSEGLGKCQFNLTHRRLISLEHTSLKQHCHPRGRINSPERRLGQPLRLDYFLIGPKPGLNNGTQSRVSRLHLPHPHLLKQFNDRIGLPDRPDCPLQQFLRFHQSA